MWVLECDILIWKNMNVTKYEFKCIPPPPKLRVWQFWEMRKGSFFPQIIIPASKELNG